MSKEKEKSQKQIEKEKKRQEKIDRKRAELAAYIKTLPVYNQWLFYSKEKGSYENRLRYAGTKKGEQELRKRFGPTLNKTPKNWDQVEMDLEQKDMSALQLFIKLLNTIATTWGF